LDAIKEQRDAIVKALKNCVSKDAVEDTFNEYTMSDLNIRIDRLNETMGNPQTFFSSDSSLKTRYEVTVRMFLSRKWELAVFYEKAGVLGRE
jgi:hypothetical protein